MRTLSLLTLSILLIGLTISLPTYSYASTQDSVVKVFTASVTYDYDSPWQVSSIENGTGSGCIISDRQILTNAHVVSNSTFIEVQLYGQPTKYTATVKAISHEADLALLVVEDSDFFNDTIPLKFGNLPELLDSVVVYGFPEGGDGLSLTKGIVSRIEVTEYVHSRMDLLGLQIDAAINAGNSGGPVIMDGKIIGVAMQTLNNAENIAYIIPTPIIEHFLTDLADGTYNGFPTSGVVVQSLDNQALRESLALPDDKTGIYVAYVVPGTSADGFLKKGDVVLTVDNYNVANDGSIPLRPGLRLTADYYINNQQIGDTVAIGIWREGTEENISIPLTTKKSSTNLVLPEQYDNPPEYYIVSGIVFSPLTFNYLLTWGDDIKQKAPWKLLRYFFQKKSTVDEQVVIISNLLTSGLTSGYEKMVDTRVISVNGEIVTSFNQFIVLVDRALSKNKLFTLETETHEVLVISPKEHQKNEKSLLKLYGIDRSKRLTAISPFDQ